MDKEIQARNARFIEERHFRFLDRLRESGSINMFGAPSVLKEEFGMSKAEATGVFVRWTKAFAGRQEEARKKAKDSGAVGGNL